MQTQERFKPAGLDFANYKAKHFLWQLDGKVATITLNRPERKNPLTLESYSEMRDLFRNLTYADGVKAVVLNGAGGNFCSGGDVHDIIGPLVAMQEADDMGGLLAFTRMTGDLVKAMRNCPQPIVSAIDGICAGERETIFFTDSRYEVIPAPKGDAPPPPVGSPERRVVEAANDQQTAHVAEWLDAVRTRGKVSCPPEDAYRSTAAVQLAMIALKAGGRVGWDGATEQVRDNPKAASLLKRDYRGPWVHPWKG